MEVGAINWVTRPTRLWETYGEVIKVGTGELVHEPVEGTQNSYHV